MDLIDRQAAIDHFRLIIDATNTDSRYNIGFVDGLEFCISHLSTMPSAQSGLDEWCTDCKEYDKERHCCPRWNRVIRETVEEWKSNQPEIIHCGDCRHWKNEHLCKCLSRYGTFETEIHFYCGFAERRDE